ncbi:MAG: WYL domain-containing protein, partial [Actinobacteria bacterium]|nr:WYL domain-containing protein [Actinomycetota bacterium]
MDRLERLLNLVIALRETRLPLTAEDIRTRVAGYGQEERESFRRMFERDKADLRELGVPITQSRVSRWDDRQGYRIDARAYELPPLAFAGDELTSLAFAVALTGLGDEAGSGLLKLAVDADYPDAATAATTPPVRLEVDAPHRRDLMAAIHGRTTVAFTYRPRGAQAGRRRVDPQALVHVRGRWYLLGHDHDRDADRTYRLDRITSTVRVVSEPGAFPARNRPVAPDEEELARNPRARS